MSAAAMRHYLDDDSSDSKSDSEFLESIPESPPMARLKSLQHQKRYTKECLEDDLLSSSDDDSSLYEKENRVPNRRSIYQKAASGYDYATSHSGSSIHNDMDYSSSITGSLGDMTGETTATSQDTCSLPDTDSMSDQYAPIQRKKPVPSKISPPLENYVYGPRLSSIEELPSPIHPTGNGDLSPLVTQGNYGYSTRPSTFNPPHTSTTTHLPPMMPPPLPPKPMGMYGHQTHPKTNPNYPPRNQVLSSTPRQARTRRIPKIKKYDDILAQSTSIPIDPLPHGMALPPPPREREYTPMDFGCPSNALARKCKINGILFLSMTMSERHLRVRIQRSHFFFDPPPFLASFVRLELVPAGDHGRKRSVHQRHINLSERTHRIRRTRNPIFDEKFTFDIASVFYKSLQISVYTLNPDRRHQDFYGGMTFSIKKLEIEAARRNGGKLPSRQQKIDIISDGYFLMTEEGASKNLACAKIKHHKEYDARQIDGVGYHGQDLMLPDDRMASVGESSSSWARSYGSGPSGFSSPYERHKSKSASSINGGLDSMLTFDYTTASSSSGISGSQMCGRFPTGPSVPTFKISSHISESDTTDPDGQPTCAKVSHDHLQAQRDDVPPPRENKGGLNSAIRRAQSFTFSPKGSVPKEPPRAAGSKEETKRRLL
ncbi:unnamed protein product, partial [Mesorhabditis spiculigera]